MSAVDVHARTRTEHRLRLRPGTILEGRYEIMRELGAGGFATVYDGRDLRMRRTVAIKVLNLLSISHNQAQMEKALARFRLEAQMAASISHPNVVAIYGSGVTEGEDQPYIIMERLQGHSLSEECQRHRVVDPRRLLPLIDQCLAGLATAHAQGIVHRDLKPSNLFLHQPRSPEERLYLLDFGIAHLSGNHSDLTGTGHIFGTPRFLPPEYIMEQRVSPALDVYQIGLLLAEALTGVIAVRDEFPVACFFKHINGELRVSRTLMQTDLGEIIAKALSPNPDRRYRNAEELRWALSHIDPYALPPLDGGPECSLREVVPHWEPVYYPSMGGQQSWGLGGAFQSPAGSPQTPMRAYTPALSFQGATPRGEAMHASPSGETSADWGSALSDLDGSLEDSTRQEIPRPQPRRVAPMDPVSSGRYAVRGGEGLAQSSTPLAMQPGYASMPRAMAYGGALPPERLNPPTQEVALARDAEGHLFSSGELAALEEDLLTSPPRRAEEAGHVYARAGGSGPVAIPSPAALAVANGEAPARRPWEILAILGILLVLASLVLVLVYALQKDKPPQAPLPVQVTPVVTPAAPVVTPLVTPAPSAPAAVTTPAAVAAPAAVAPSEEAPDEGSPAQDSPAVAAVGPVSVELQTACKAVVRRGTRKLGYTPLALTFASAEEPPVVVRLRCEGTEIIEVLVGPGDGPVREVDMSRPKTIQIEPVARPQGAKMKRW
jgi:serine/threonine protein kinase